MNGTIAFSAPQHNFQNKYHSATSLFNQSISRGHFRKFVAFFTRKTTDLLSVNVTAGKNKNVMPGIKNINLDEIVGSEGRVDDFDNRFNPLKFENKDRWVSVALAFFDQKPLPPVLLIQTNRGLFVRDGHHRISVARAFGQATIEAEIV